MSKDILPHIKIKKVSTITDIERKKFNFINLDERWKKHLGDVERAGCTLIMGDSGHGKTAYSLQLAKAFGASEKIHYNSAEEGVSSTFKRTLKLNNVKLIDANFQFSQETYDELVVRLKRRRQPKIVFIDSIQYCFRGKKVTDFFELLKMFPKTHFVGVSHYEKGKPVGVVAMAFYWDCQNRIFVENWKAYLDKSRTGGNEIDPFIISEAKASERELKLVKNG